MRKTSEELQNLMIKFDAKTLWSWSKYNSYFTDPYSYLLKYIKKIKPDRGGNAYSFLGGVAHDLLEKFYKGEIDNKGMVQEFSDKAAIRELSNIRFDANDERNESIGNKYIECVKHFLNEYEKQEGAKLEQFICGKIGDHLFQGYVDKMYVKDNILYVEDYKTSTMYTGKKIDTEKGQLMMYAILLNKMFPQIPIDRIKIKWNFLKYVSIDCEQVNGKIATTHSIRNEIGDKLENKLKTWLKKEKCSDEEIEDAIQDVKTNNTMYYKDRDCLENLSKTVQDKFVIRDCVVEIDINAKEIDLFINDVNRKCNQILDKEKEYKQTENDKLFWVTIDNSNSYYFNTLCDYSTKHHMPLKEYYEEYEKMKVSSDEVLQQNALDQFIFG